MRIAQLTPLIQSVPPLRHGGIKRIVSYLTEELVGSSQEVPLFASGDSLISVGSARGSMTRPFSMQVQAPGCRPWTATNGMFFRG